MKVRLLLDENLSPGLAAALRRSRGEFDVLRVGSIGRTQGSITFPARFTLVAATNPCPCVR